MHSPSIINSELVGLLYHGATEVNPWSSFLRELRKRTKSDVAAIILRQPNSNTLPVTFYDRQYLLTGNQLRRVQRDHSELLEEDPLHNALQAPGEALILSEVVEQRQFKQSIYYQKLIEPFGIGRQIGINLGATVGWTCHLGLMRQASDQDFSQQEKNLLTEIYPHFQQALYIYLQLEKSKIECTILKGCLSSLGVGIATLDQGLNITQSNVSAHSKASFTP